MPGGQNTVFFDFDGTLYYGTAQLNAWCFAGALEAMGLPPPTEEMIHQSVGLTFPQIARLMTGREDAASLGRFEEETFLAVPRYIDRFVRPQPEVKDMLAALSGEAALAVCSNASPRYLYPMLDALELTGYFAEIWAHHEGITKAEAISVLAARLAAGRIVFVGDRLEDVSAARQAGVKVVGMRNAAYPWETDGADAVATDPAGMLKAIRALLTQAKE